MALGSHEVMTPDPACPVCHAEHWEVLGRKTFARTSSDGQPAFIRARLKVLFELWAPGQDEVRVEYVLCRRCGMVVYRPRPIAAEVDAKYRFLHGAGAPLPGSDPSEIERRRSRELFRALEPYLQGPRSRVLDFGGFRGALMSELAAHGCECSVVDYAPDALPGVTRLGDTLADLGPNERFDVIVCSHVLEHLVEPLETCKALASYLEPGGLLFVEVPLEILGSFPRQGEPVTHLNFFARESLEVLLELAGLRVEHSREVACTVGNGKPRLVVRAFARHDPGQSARAVRFEGRAGRVRRLVGAGRVERWRWRLRHPRLLMNLPEQVKRRMLALRGRGARTSLGE